MPALFEESEAFVFKIARLYRALAHKKKPDLVIQCDAEFHVPLPPNLARLLGQRRIIFVPAVGWAIGLTDIRGGGEWEGSRNGISQRNFLRRMSQLMPRSNATHPRANQDRLGHD